MGSSRASIADIVECFNSSPEIFTDSVTETSGVPRRKEKGLNLFAIDVAGDEFAGVSSISSISDLLEFFFVSKLEIISSVTIVECFRRKYTETV